MRRSAARAIAALLAALLAGGTPLARAASFPQNPHLGQAQEALDAGDLDQASQELQRALAQPDNSDDVLVEIYKLQGIVALYRGDRAAARQALEKLFQARPDYALPKGTSPKIRDLFNEVQEDVRKRRVKPVTLTFEPLTQLAAGGPANLSAQVDDLPEGARVRLFYRRAGSEAFSALELQRGANGAFSGTLPAAELPIDAAPFGLEYYLEVDDAAGRRLAGRGDSLAPLTVRVHAPQAETAPVQPPPPEAEEETAWYGQWYLWAGVGVVAAAAAGVGIYYATRPATGTLPVTVTVTQP
jgi:tetratricopeptide (TPR) repeat protein